MEKQLLIMTSLLQQVLAELKQMNRSNKKLNEQLMKESRQNVRESRVEERVLTQRLLNESRKASDEKLG